MKNLPCTPAKALVVAATVVLLSCGSLENQPSAGGSGAGNPGGTVAIAVKIQTNASLGKTVVTGAQNNLLTDSAKQVTVTDKGGLKLIINSVSISNADIRFILDASESPQVLVPRPLPGEKPGLSYDSNSIIIPGPFEFNAMKQVPDSALPPIHLPVARYIGVSIHFESDSIIFEKQRLSRGRIVISGKFDLNGTTHAFTFYITLTLQPFYRFAGGIFTLSKSDTTHIDLQFDAKRWFANVDLESYIRRGEIAFDDSGNLNISTFNKRYYCREIEFIIAEDFAASGKLVVY